MANRFIGAIAVTGRREGVPWNAETRNSSRPRDVTGTSSAAVLEGLSLSAGRNVWVMRWAIADSRRNEPPSGSVSQAAESGYVEITDGTETRRITVDLSGPAAASGLTFNPRGGVWFNIEDAVSDYLDLADPPSHVVVTPFGVEPAGSD